MSLLIYLPGYPVPFTSSLPIFIPMDILLHSLGFLVPSTSSLSLFYSCGPVSHQSCHSILLGLFPHPLAVFPFPPSLYCWASSAVGSLLKMGINIQPPKHMNCLCNSYLTAYANLFIIIIRKFFK